MIGMRDRLELPGGVVPDGDGLRDDVRGVTLPLNASGRVLVGECSVEAMAGEAVTRLAAPPARAVSDACVFALDLNRRHLLNVRVRGGLVVIAWRWLWAACVLVHSRTLPAWPAHRRPLDTSAPMRAAAGAAAAALPAGAGGAAVAVAGPLAVGFPSRLVLPAAIALAAGVAVHEAGHALCLRGIPAFVGRRGMRVAVFHRPVPPRRAALVALGGPSVGVVFALAVAATAWSVAAPELAAAAAALTPQALALTVVAADGRRACAGC